jgi:hypothetical protein
MPPRARAPRARRSTSHTPGAPRCPHLALPPPAHPRTTLSHPLPRSRAPRRAAAPAAPAAAPWPPPPPAACAARRRGDDYEPTWRRQERGSGSDSWRGSGEGGAGGRPYHVTINGAEIKVPQGTLWRAALPAAALLAGAAFVGPFVVAAAAGALAIGAGLAAAGAAATALLFPFFFIAGAGALLSFGAWAAVGAAVMLPSLLLFLALVRPGGGGGSVCGGGAGLVVMRWAAVM